MIKELQSLGINMLPEKLYSLEILHQFHSLLIGIFMLKRVMN